MIEEMDNLVSSVPYEGRGVLVQIGKNLLPVTKEAAIRLMELLQKTISKLD